MEKSVEFVLKKPLEYSKDGSKHQEQMLILSAPTFGSTQTKKNARKLKQLGSAALMKVAERFPSDPKKKADLKDEPTEKTNIFEVFYMADVDVQPMIDVFGDLAQNVVKIGGQHDFKQKHWDDLGMDEQERLTGEYLENFLMPSVSSSKS